MRQFLPLLLAALCLGGCVRREGRNSDCRWPGEPGAKRLDLSRSADKRHLSADAEFAEDLGIRYADTHFGLRSGHFTTGEMYGGSRDRCMKQMFQAIGQTHGVPAEEVSAALGKNRGRLDLAINLPFVLLYGLAAALLVRFVWRRYPPEDGWVAGVVMILVGSLLVGLAGVMVGNVWEAMWETERVGNGHMSYRASRFLWARYGPELFVMNVLIFWLIAVAGYRLVVRRPRLEGGS